MKDGRNLAVIPARLGSRRFPDKALSEMCGEPMIRHVVRRAREAMPTTRVIVATDSAEIAARVEDLAEVFLSDTPHACGTDRVAEAAAALGGDARYVLNLQGDEPCVPGEAITAVLAELISSGAPMASACVPMRADAPGFEAPDVVKVVLGEDGSARYFSRAPVPHGAQVWYAHVGVYGFTRSALEAFAEMTPSTLERAERLEQLRVVDAGWPIAMARLDAFRDHLWPSVNRPEDRARAERYLVRLGSRQGGPF